MYNNKITHVIFDLGGIIIDLGGVASYLNELARKRGLNLTPENIDEFNYIFLNGGQKSDLFNFMFNKLKVKSQDECIDLLNDLVLNGYKRSDQLVPGVDKLIQHLYHHKIPMAVASNCSSNHFQIFRINFGQYFDKYFTHCVCGRDDPDVQRNKPDPQVYHVCAQRFPTPGPVSPQSVLIVEDSMRGIEGAIESGMKTLLINDFHHGLDNRSVLATKVTAIANCFDDFDPQLVGLPAYDNI